MIRYHRKCRGYGNAQNRGLYGKVPTSNRSASMIEYHKKCRGGGNANTRGLYRDKLALQRLRKYTRTRVRSTRRRRNFSRRRRWGSAATRRK